MDSADVTSSQATIVPTARRHYRTVIIEPVLALYFTAWIPFSPLAQQYLYNRIASDVNLTAGGSSVKAPSGPGGSWTNGTTWPMTTVTAGPTPAPGECRVKPNTSDFLKQQQVQATTAEWMMYTDLAMDIPSLIVSLFLGTYGDRIGRKLCLLLPPIGACLRCAVFLIHSFFKLPLWFLIFGSLLEGFTGSSTTLVSSCYAYLADVTTLKSRGLRMAVADVVYGVCIGIGQAGMGMLIQATGFRIPILVVIGFHLINIIYLIILVPQVRPAEKESNDTSLPVEKTAQHKDVPGRDNTKDSDYKKKEEIAASDSNNDPKHKGKGISLLYVLESFKVFSGSRGTAGRRPRLLLVVCAFVLISSAQTARWGLQTLFVLNYPLCWNSALLGIFNAIIALVTNVAQIVLAGLCLKHVGEAILVLVGSVSAFGYFILLAFSTTTVMMMMVPMVGFASSLPTSLMRAIMSKIVEPWEQGALFASVTTLDKLVSTLGVALFNSVYAASLLVFRGAVFVLLAGLVLIGFILILIYTVLLKWKHTSYGMSDDRKTGQELTRL